MNSFRFIKNQLTNWFWHWPKSFLAFSFVGPKRKKIKIIGVSGTKGKTTTSYLMAKILEKAGYNVALICTAVIKIKNNEWLNNLKMTTPSVGYLYRFIRRAVKEKCQYLVLEISSHAIKQYRIFGLKIDYLILTNLTPDHLEYHRTSQDYLFSHQKLANQKSIQQVVINGQDPFINQLKFKNPIIDFSRNEELKNQIIALKPPLLGKFNLENYLAASQLALTFKISWEKIKEAINEVKTVPGRLELIDLGQDFKVMVDYAHSPPSLLALFSVIKELNPQRIIVVFGACGERDKSQRPIMGEILAQNAQIIIITNDDPYHEDPELIAEGVLEGIKKHPAIEVFKILDRRSAIKKALTLARKGDWVLILGKGAEQFQIIKNKKIPWDDRQVVKEIWKEIKEKS